VVFALCFIRVYVSILKIVGAVNGEPAFLLPYIVYSLIAIVLSVIVSILFFVLIIETKARIISGFIPLVYVSLLIYFCFVVISLYKQQKAENDNSRKIQCDNITSFS
jgi:Domain of unknown function (DUF4728)